MNARIRVGAFAVAGGLLTACSGVRSGVDPQQLRDADLAFARATAERRLEGFRSFLAGDAMTIRPDVPVVKGAGGPWRVAYDSGVQDTAPAAPRRN